MVPREWSMHGRANQSTLRRETALNLRSVDRLLHQGVAPDHSALYVNVWRKTRWLSSHNLLTVLTERPLTSYRNADDMTSQNYSKFAIIAHQKCCEEWHDLSAVRFTCQMDCFVGNGAEQEVTVVVRIPNECWWRCIRYKSHVECSGIEHGPPRWEARDWPTAGQGLSVSVTQTSQLMLYREIIAVCSEIHTKHINTVCGQNVELLKGKLAVHVVTAGL